MSSLKLKHASGNSVSIAAPEANPASDRTLYLPSNADGTVLTTTSPKAGNILQVVSNTVTAVLNNDTASGGNWIPGHLETSITPSATSSKILVTGCIQMDAAIAMGIYGQLQRDSALIAGANAPAAGNRQRCHSGVRTSGSTTIAGLIVNYLDSPSSTSSETYRLKFFHSSGHTRQLYINRTQEDTDDATFARGVSTITLMEIAG